jgi:hypothetical protein
MEKHHWTELALDAVTVTSALALSQQSHQQFSGYTLRYSVAIPRIAAL